MSECQEFDGRRDKHGYGRISIKTDSRSTSSYLAHRLAWALHNGADPGKAHIRHTCDNPPCVNPEHLILGTVTENMRDMSTRHRCGKLTAEQVAEVKSDRALGFTYSAIGAKYGIHLSTAHYVCSGKTWKNG